ncbi:unnamed protein product [Rhodiola kirilowii]
MPSGAKRRKSAAAKKKKEQEASSGSEATGSFNGVENLNGQESDVGEVSSPASQDPLQSGGQSFTEEGGYTDSSPVRQIDSVKDIVEEDVLVEGVGVVKVDEDNGSVEITKELKSGEVSESRDLSVEVCQGAEGSSDGSSSSSSSDDEKIDVEKTDVVLDSDQVEEVYEVVENTVDSPVPDSIVEEIVYVSEASPVEEPYEDPDRPAFSNSEVKATTVDALPVLPPTIEGLGKSSNVESDVEDADGKALPPADSPIAVPSNGVVHFKDPEIHGSTENLTPVLQAPLSVHRTSWKGCCGLFEVFTG